MKLQSQTQNCDTSKLIFERALKVLPGGVSRNTIYRDPHPYYASNAHGSYIRDINGVERLDFANNMASLIHGHSYSPIIDAVSEQMKKGTAFTMGNRSRGRFC